MTPDAPLTEPRRALLSDDWFSHCAADFQDALLSLGRQRQLATGEPLFAQGEPGAGLYGLLAGAITVQSCDVEGEMPILLVIEPCHWFGELSLVDGQPRSHEAVADVASTVWFVPRQALEDWLALHPQHWRDVARLMAGKLRIAYQVFDQEMRRPMTQRVARRLWLAVQGWGWHEHQPRQRLRLSQEQLTRMLGASRSSVNKSLRELETLGALRLHYAAIEVLDLSLLRHGCGP